MDIEEPRKLAEAHWKYTEEVINKMMEMMKYLYIESMIHGIKHGKDSLKK